MSVVVLGRNGAGSIYYITGYHGPGCVWLDIVFFIPNGDYILC